jgi:hypothetical protein
MIESKELRTDTYETMSIGDSEGNSLKEVPNFGMNESPFIKAEFPINLKHFAYNCLKLADKKDSSGRSNKEAITMTTLNNCHKSEFVKNTKGHYLTSNIGDVQSIRDSRLDTFNHQNNFENQINSSDLEYEGHGFIPQNSNFMKYEDNIVKPDDLLIPYDQYTYNDKGKSVRFIITTIFIGGIMPVCNKPTNLKLSYSKHYLLFA